MRTDKGDIGTVTLSSFGSRLGWCPVQQGTETLGSRERAEPKNGTTVLHVIMPSALEHSSFHFMFF